MTNSISLIFFFLGSLSLVLVASLQVYVKVCFYVWGVLGEVSMDFRELWCSVYLLYLLIWYTGGMGKF